MKVLVVTQKYFPENFLVNDIARQLVVDGHEVTVLTGLPDHVNGEIPVEYRSSERLLEKVEGVEIVRCKIYPRKTGVVNRALNYASFLIQSIRKLKHLPKDYDIILCYQPSPVSSAHAGIHFGKKYGIPTILYCLDLWPESLKAWNMGEKNVLFVILKYYSKKIYSNADKLIVSSRPFTDYMESVHSINANEIGYLPQHAKDEFAETFFMWDENGVVDFVFAGNIGSVQLVNELVEAFIVLSKDIQLPKWKLHIFGDGSEYEKIEASVSESGLQEKIILYGRISPEELVSYYQLADVFILGLQNDNKIGDTLPAKVQGYMSAGRPVVAMAGGATTEVLDEAKCGKAVLPGDINKYSDVLREYVLSDDLRKKHGLNGRLYFERHFRLENYMSGLYDIVEQVINR